MEPCISALFPSNSPQTSPSFHPHANITFPLPIAKYPIRCDFFIRTSKKRKYFIKKSSTMPFALGTLSQHSFPLNHFRTPHRNLGHFSKWELLQ